MPGSQAAVRGRYSVGFAVEVAAGKYLNHLPLEHQSRQMAREGLAVDTQTPWNQLHALARHLEPTCEAPRERERLRTEPAIEATKEQVTSLHKGRCIPPSGAKKPPAQGGSLSS